MPAPLHCEPLTPAHWTALESLFGARGACGGCWRQSWRKPKAQFQRDKGAANRASLLALVQQGPPPGILAYCGAQPAGWCALAPRRDYIALSIGPAAQRPAPRPKPSPVGAPSVGSVPPQLPHRISAT